MIALAYAQLYLSFALGLARLQLAILWVHLWCTVQVNYYRAVSLMYDLAIWLLTFPPTRVTWTYLLMIPALVRWVVQQYVLAWRGGR